MCHIIKSWFNNHNIHFHYRNRRINPIWTTHISRSIKMVNFIKRHDWLRRTAGMNIKISNKNLYNDKDFVNWSNNWQKRISRNDSLNEKSLELMKNSNPIIIPRNHKVEEALTAANEDNLEVMNKLLSKLSKPYDDQIDIQDYQSPSNDKNYQTFCGT